MTIKICSIYGRSFCDSDFEGKVIVNYPCRQTGTGYSVHRIIILSDKYRLQIPAASVGGRLSGLRDYDKRLDRKWQTIFVR